MYDFEHYSRARDLAHAVQLLSETPDAKPIAGGTDVLVELHHASSKYRSLVDIRGLPELCGIARQDDGTLRIGSGTTFTQIIESPLIRQHLPALAHATSHIAGPQVRNVATIGGNICNGATCADAAPISIALNAQLEIANPLGRRFTPLEGFHSGPGEVGLGHDEVVVAFYFRQQDYGNVGAHYYKYAMRGAMDIASISCAAACRLDNGRFSMLRIVYGVAAPTPILCPHAQALAIGQVPGPEILNAISEEILKDLKPRSSWRASKEFRLQIGKTLAQRVVAQAVRNAQGGLA